MLTMFFGMIGLGFLMYGRSSGQLLTMGAGLLLMVMPSIMPSVLMMVLVCGAITALPLVVRFD